MDLCAYGDCHDWALIFVILLILTSGVDFCESSDFVDLEWIFVSLVILMIWRGIL